jgi:thiol:disulfide interchange protein DsbD
VAQQESIAPGGKVHLALRQKIQKDWHTYWRNSGDAGNATEIKWTLPAGWSAGEIIWPAPGRYLTQSAQFSLMNYVYEDEVFLPVEITAPATARPGETVTLTAAVSFLVCAEICVPEDALLTLKLPVTAEGGPVDVKWGQKISDVLASVPRPGQITGVFARKGQSLALALTGAPIAGAAAADAYFYPFKSTVLDHTATQTVERGPEGLTLSLTPGYDFKQGTAPTSLDGVLGGLPVAGLADNEVVLADLLEAQAPIEPLRPEVL